MTAKTIHIVEKDIEISSDPNYDRLGQSSQDYPSLYNISAEMIAAGEVPRYSGSEVDIKWESDCTIITTTFATRAGAEQWAEWVRNDNYGLISIDVVED